ncbi:hypothetical protein D3C72_741110 [compost metagenome]
MSYDPEGNNRINLEEDKELYVPEKVPPTKILSSGCMRIVRTSPLLNPAPEPNVRSKVPSLFNRIIRFCEIPLKVKKEPPTIILLSDCIAMAYTYLSKPLPILKFASILPSGFNLTKPAEGNPLKVLKCPPTKIFPSDCKTTLSMVSSAPEPIIKLGSFVPSGSILVILLALTVDPLYFVNDPAAIIF